MTPRRFSKPARPGVVAGMLANLLAVLVILLAVLALLLALQLRRPSASFALQSAVTSGRQSEKSADTSGAVGQPPQIQTATPQIPCNWAALVIDGTTTHLSVGNGEKFTQTWQVQNIGTCAWNADYELVFASGSDLGGPQAQKLGTAVDVGATIAISIELVAPVSSGNYIAHYQLRSDDGIVFGLDDDFSQPLWVAISTTAR
ncbi:MAG: NBR1-Ig-like domain-containing protein [Chloroflexota bacterium]